MNSCIVAWSRIIHTLFFYKTNLFFFNCSQWLAWYLNINVNCVILRYPFIHTLYRKKQYHLQFWVVLFILGEMGDSGELIASISRSYSKIYVSSTCNIFQEICFIWFRTSVQISIDLSLLLLRRFYFKTITPQIFFILKTRLSFKSWDVYLFKQFDWLYCCFNLFFYAYELPRFSHLPFFLYSH